MANKKNLTLICTGFHRSATSATANYLFDAGLNLGDNLMAGNISNAKGHFEDWEVVTLHDSLLDDSSSSWQFHDECDIERNLKKIDNYVQERNSQSKQWGVKDPRACLFLNDWFDVLKKNGRYLLIVRHWSSCTESLLHRHSRELAHQLSTLNNDDVNLQFWLQPELAAKMWLSYNQRILAFAKAHPDKVLLVTQRALFEGAPILSTLNNQYGFNLDIETKSPFEPKLLRDQANIRVANSLSYAFKNKLDTVWRSLISIADFKSENEEPIYLYPPCLDNNTLTKYQAEIDNIKLVDLEVKKRNYEVKGDWLDKLLILDDPDEIIKQLDAVKGDILLDLNTSELLEFIDNNYKLNGTILLSVAKLLVRLSEPKLAILYFQRAITLGIYYPCIDMMLGQCYLQLMKFDEAMFFFNKAIQKNPNNPLFYINKAKLLLVLNNNEDAECAFQDAYNRDSDSPGCVLPYCDFLLKNNRTDEAISLLNKLKLKTSNVAASNMLTQIALKADYVKGKKSYLENVKAKMQGKNKIEWLAQVGTLISDNKSETDFIIRINEHWQDVDECIG